MSLRKTVLRCLQSVTYSIVMVSTLCLVTTSCKDDNDGVAKEIEAEEYVENPTTDKVEVSYGGLTAIVGSDLSDDMGLAISKRLTNTTSQLTDDVKAVVLTPVTLSSGITADQAASLIQLYDKGATIIFVEPKKANLDNFATVLKAGCDLLEERGQVTDGIDAFLALATMRDERRKNDDHTLNNSDAVALRINEMYVVDDIAQQADYSLTNTDAIKVDDNGNVDTVAVVNSNEDLAYEVSDYRYGKAADLLMTWMNDASASAAQLEKGKRLAMAKLKATASEVSLKDLMNAQKITVQKSVGPSRAFGRTMPYEIQYFIYGVYDFDNDDEYYLIRQHLEFHATQLQCTKNDKDSWTKSPKDKKIRLDNGDIVKNEYFFGPYMRKSRVTTNLENISSETVYLYDPKPETTVGTHGHSSGVSWGISGSLGLSSNGDINGTVGWGVTLSETFSNSESDLKVERTTSSPRMTSWLLEGIKPEVKYGFLTSNSHTTVATFQTRDWSDDLTWYYRISHPDKSKTYSLYVTDYTEIAELNYSFHDYEIAVHPLQSHHVDLDSPCRYKQDWVMTCTNEDLLNNIKSQLKGWESSTTTYAVKAQLLDDNMIRRFNGIKNSVGALADVLYKQGYTGKYIFMVRKQGDSKNFKAFALGSGVVSDVTD